MRELWKRASGQQTSKITWYIYYKDWEFPGLIVVLILCWICRFPLDVQLFSFHFFFFLKKILLDNKITWYIQLNLSFFQKLFLSPQWNTVILPWFLELDVPEFLNQVFVSLGLEGWKFRIPLYSIRTENFLVLVIVRLC